MSWKQWNAYMDQLKKLAPEVAEAVQENNDMVRGTQPHNGEGKIVLVTEADLKSMVETFQELEQIAQGPKHALGEETQLKLERAVAAFNQRGRA